MSYLDPRPLLRRSQLVGVIEKVCVTLELSSSQYEDAKGRYEGVGDWLAQSDDPLLASIAIGLQGSVAIRTTVKPIGTNEHDVDLVAHVPNLDIAVSPAALKASIGTRLRSNGHYAPLLEEMPRCWRLNYANEFHMDIMPSIPNPSCRYGGELVPDKALKSWKASNPKGYRELFEKRANLLPRIRVSKGLAHDRMRADADVEPYPEHSGFKGVLRRVVQIAKRHRDIHFIDDDPCLAPLSIIITTLASRAYEFCVSSSFEYNSELDLLCDVLRRMPDTIEIGIVDGRPVWSIWNETTAGENFAEKWNKDPRHATAFFSWHAQALADLKKLASVQGLDEVTRLLGGIFGNAPATKALNALTDRVTSARTTGRLSVARSAGLVVGASAGSTSVRANTFFGRDC
jgi:SMODS domain-containing protein